MLKASVIRTTINAGTSAKPLTKMKPKPSRMFSAPGSTGPAPRSLNSGNMIAPTTIIPATRQAAKKAKTITNRRPISAMADNRGYFGHCEEQSDEAIQNPVGASDCFAALAMTTCLATASIPSIRHRHRAQRLPFARRQFLAFRFQLAACGKNVAAARGANRRGVSGVENIFGEFFDLLPVGALVPRAEI